MESTISTVTTNQTQGINIFQAAGTTDRQRQQLTFGLLPGWRDVETIGISYKSAVVRGRPIIKKFLLQIKFNLLTEFSGRADGTQKPARQQAVYVGRHFKTTSLS